MDKARMEEYENAQSPWRKLAVLRDLELGQNMA
jgi:hypothetical protein